MQDTGEYYLYDKILNLIISPGFGFEVAYGN